MQVFVVITLFSFLPCGYGCVPSFLYCYFVLFLSVEQTLHDSLFASQTKAAGDNWHWQRTVRVLYSQQLDMSEQFRSLLVT